MMKCITIQINSFSVLFPNKPPTCFDKQVTIIHYRHTGINSRTAGCVCVTATVDRELMDPNGSRLLVAGAQRDGRGAPRQRPKYLSWAGKKREMGRGFLS
jgi:hypothetical protein